MPFRIPHETLRLLPGRGRLWQRRFAGDGVSGFRYEEADDARARFVMRVSGQTDDEAQLAELIVKTLNLEVAPAEIDPDAPLFGEGLGLDSIDILEVALAVSQTYGVKLRADDENNTAIFQSLRRLSSEIQARRTA
jgi:acyl carrier protein